MRLRQVAGFDECQPQVVAGQRAGGIQPDGGTEVALCLRWVVVEAGDTQVVVPKGQGVGVRVVDAEVGRDVEAAFGLGRFQQDALAFLVADTRRDVGTPLVEPAAIGCPILRVGRWPVGGVRLTEPDVFEIADDGRHGWAPFGVAGEARESRANVFWPACDGWFKGR